jgi:hypothetical protein
LNENLPRRVGTGYLQEDTGFGAWNKENYS